VLKRLGDAFDASGPLATLPHVVEALCNVVQAHLKKGRAALLGTLTAYVLRCVAVSRLAFSRVWANASATLVLAGKQADIGAVEIAVDGIRQVAFAMLPLAELSQFHLQRDVLMPLEVTAMANPASRGLVIGAIRDIVDTRARELSSAWPMVRSILLHAAACRSPLCSWRLCTSCTSPRTARFTRSRITRGVSRSARRASHTRRWRRPSRRAGKR